MASAPFTTTLPASELDTRVKEQRHAYALVYASANTHFPLTATAVLGRAAEMPKEPSQSWCDDESMQGTGEGYYAPRNPQGTDLVDILAESHPKCIPHVMTVNKTVFVDRMLELAYVRREGKVAKLCFEPWHQDAVNQPIGTLKRGDTVVCFQEDIDKQAFDSDDFCGVKFYAIKLRTSEGYTALVLHDFLEAYKAASDAFYIKVHTAQRVANADKDQAIRKRKVAAEEEAERKRQTQEALLEERCKHKAEELAQLEAELAAAKRARR